MRKRETTHVTTEPTASFELKLPPVFVVNPEHEVILPAKRRALVFGEQIAVPDYDKAPPGKDHGYKMVEGWRVVIVGQDGSVSESFLSNSTLGYRYNRQDVGYVFSCPLQVAFFIKSVAKELTPKKRVERSTSAVDYED